MLRSERGILRLAIRSYGEDAQEKMLLEEMAELQKEICKAWRGKDNVDCIADEIADVEIMLDQMKIMFRIEEKVKEHRKLKLLRLERRLEEKE